MKEKLSKYHIVNCARRKDFLMNGAGGFYLKSILKLLYSAVFFVVLCLFSSTSIATPQANMTKPSPTSSIKTINLQQEFGVSELGIRKSIIKARKIFKQAPNTTVIIKFPAGKFILGNQDSSRSEGGITLRNISPGPEGRLIFQGAGISPSHNTTLVYFNGWQDYIFAHNIHHVMFKDLIFARNKYTISQGAIQQVDRQNHTLSIKLEKGYPTPDQLFNKHSSQGRFLRLYSATNPLKPTIIVDNKIESTLAWKSAELIGQRVWKFHIQAKRKKDEAFDGMQFYKPGMFVGIKSKPQGQAFQIFSGNDFVFDTIKWTYTSRGVFRRVNNIKILNCIIAKLPSLYEHAPFMATPGGGPQIGNPQDQAIHNVLIDNLVVQSTGDDSLAFFNVDNGIIKNCRISDSFSRGILLYNSPQTILENNTIIRCPIAHCTYSGSQLIDSQHVGLPHHT